MAERVHSYLVTGPVDGRGAMQIATAAVANWLETRRRTTLVTCFDEDSEDFLGDTGETYKLLVGEPGSGWSVVAVPTEEATGDGV